MLLPENANVDFTEEDSGEENQVVINNLPASQLRAAADFSYKNVPDDLWDNEDDLPLSHFFLN